MSPKPVAAEVVYGVQTFEERFSSILADYPWAVVLPHGHGYATPESYMDAVRWLYSSEADYQWAGADIGMAFFFTEATHATEFKLRFG